MASGENSEATTGDTNRSIKLVVSDMDGTLLDKRKDISVESHKAAAQLVARGIKLCLVSSRFPPGMERFHRALALDTPLGALNGAEIIDAQGKILSSLTLKRDVVQKACDILRENKVDAWIYSKRDWFVTDAEAPLVAHESEVVAARPTVVDDLGAHFDEVGKIQAVSDDEGRLAALEHEMRDLLRGVASVHRSSGYYLDITPQDANKGYAATFLARYFGYQMHEVACIGDMSNDIPMLECAGVSIAMGNAHDEVKQHARHVTSSNAEEGWAEAMRNFVL